MKSVKIELRDFSLAISDYYTFNSTFYVYSKVNTRIIHDRMTSLIRAELNEER